MVARQDETKPRTDEEKALTLSDIRDAGQDCRLTVASWAQRRELYVKQYENETYNWFERMYRTAVGAAKKD